MWAFIGTVLVGMLCIAIGISNMRGNLSSLHFYHTHRVAEEDRIPFGKRIGLGTIFIGSGVVSVGGFSILSLLTDAREFLWAGNVAFIVTLIIGLAFIFYALFRYNKGIF
jgi:hypothetical protein